MRVHSAGSAAEALCLTGPAPALAAGAVRAARMPAATCAWTPASWAWSCCCTVGRCASGIVASSAADGPLERLPLRRAAGQDGGRAGFRRDRRRHGRNAGLHALAERLPACWMAFTTSGGGPAGAAGAGAVVFCAKAGTAARQRAAKAG